MVAELPPWYTPYPTHHTIKRILFLYSVDSIYTYLTSSYQKPPISLFYFQVFIISISPFAYNCGTNISMRGDWMKTTPATNKPACTARVKAGVFWICDKYDSFSAGVRPDIVYDGLMYIIT